MVGGCTVVPTGRGLMKSPAPSKHAMINHGAHDVTSLASDLEGRRSDPASEVGADVICVRCAAASGEH